MQKKHGLSPLVLLFDSHPMLAVAGKAPDMILQPVLRDELIAKTGAGKRIVSFGEIKNMSCREFFEKILIETDAPYLAPHPHRGECNHSGLLEFTAQTIADVHGITVEEVAKITAGNAAGFYGIKL